MHPVDTLVILFGGIRGEGDVRKLGKSSVVDLEVRHHLVSPYIPATTISSIDTLP
jgi:hypothetical protein